MEQVGTQVHTWKGNERVMVLTTGGAYSEEVGMTTVSLIACNILVSHIADPSCLCCRATDTWSYQASMTGECSAAGL